MALTVWIFDETGSAAWVGAATIGRFVPALIFSAYGGVLADRFERFALMRLLDVVAGIVMLALAALTAAHAPVALVIITAARPRSGRALALEPVWIRTHRAAPLS